MGKFKAEPAWRKETWDAHLSCALPTALHCPIRRPLSAIDQDLMTPSALHNHCPFGPPISAERDSRWTSGTSPILQMRKQKLT